MMSLSELAFLRAIALALPDGARVAELGSWKGLGSTRVFCETLREIDGHLTAVDTFRGDEHIGEVDIEAAFRANTAAYGDMLDVVVSESAQAANAFHDRSFDCIFIDATHTYAGVLRDIRAWAPKLKQKGVMCGHDYGHFGMTIAVKQCYGRVGVWQTIWYTADDPRTRWRYRAEAALRRLPALS
jgi:predicted O-methyltransferase YrrM